MGTTLGTIKAAINADDRVARVISDPKHVEAASKLFIAAKGDLDLPESLQLSRPASAGRGSAVIPRRDYGPKQ